VKLVTFQIAGKPELLPGLFTDRGVVSLADAVPAGATPTATMIGVIDSFDRLRPSLERLAREGKALPMTAVRLRAPLRARARSWRASRTTGSTARSKPGRSTCSSRARTR